MGSFFRREGNPIWDFFRHSAKFSSLTGIGYGKRGRKIPNKDSSQIRPKKSITSGLRFNLPSNNFLSFFPSSLLICFPSESKITLFVGEGEEEEVAAGETMVGCVRSVIDDALFCVSLFPPKTTYAFVMPPFPLPKTGYKRSSSFLYSDVWSRIGFTMKNIKKTKLNLTPFLFENVADHCSLNGETRTHCVFLSPPFALRKYVFFPSSPSSSSIPLARKERKETGIDKLSVAPQTSGGAEADRTMFDYFALASSPPSFSSKGFSLHS